MLSNAIIIILLFSFSYDNEKENWRILTSKEIYAVVKKPSITETIRLNRLRWFGHVQRMEENRIPEKVLYMISGLWFCTSLMIT